MPQAQQLLLIVWRHGGAIALLSLAALTWHLDRRAVALSDTIRLQSSQFKQTQIAAAAIARTSLEHEEAAYEAKAMEAQNAYQARLAAMQPAADRYIAAHRVYGTAPARDTRTAVAPPESVGTAVSEILPATSVLVSTDDVQACTSAVTYGIAAHDWAKTIDP